MSSSVVVIPASVLPPIPTPQVYFGGHDDTVLQELATFPVTTFPVQKLFVKIQDIPSEFLSDASFDARLELLRYKPRKAGRNNAGFVHPCNWAGQSNDLDNGRTRGGIQEHAYSGIMPSRRSAWNLFGTLRGDPIGPVDIAPWFRYRQVVYKGGDTPPVLVQSGLAGGSLYSHENTQTGRVPRYNKGLMSLYLRFRVSIQNPNGDGTRMDRITGPESSTIRVSPSPFPIYPDDKNGVGFVASNQLVLSMANGASS